jgi:hypothetical protein
VGPPSETPATGFLINLAGIASLLPNDDDRKKEMGAEMNVHLQLNI